MGILSTERIMSDTDASLGVLSRIALMLSSSETIQAVMSVASHLANIIIPNVIGDSGTKALEWLWDKNVQRKVRKSIKKAIRESQVYRSLNREHQKILDGLVDIIRDERESILEQMREDKSFVEIVSDILQVRGIDRDDSLHIARILNTKLARVIAVQASDTNILELLFSAHENISAIKHMLLHTLVPRHRPVYFRSLQSVLFFEDVLNDIEEWRLNQSPMPRPMFFRRPHISWLDLVEGYYYERPQIIKRIERNFDEVSNIQLVVARSGAGKSTLGYILGFRRISEWGSHTYYLNLETKMGRDVTDRIVEDIENTVQSLSASQGQEQGSEKVLFIIDNIHVNVDVANEIFSRYKVSKHDLTSSYHMIDILFLARPLYENFAKSVGDLQRRVAESYDERPSRLLPTIALESDDFESTVRGIMDRFKDKVDIDEKVIEQVSQRTKGSLWLLAFIINALKSGQSLDELNLADEFRKYYFDLNATGSLLSRFHNQVFDSPFNTGQRKKERLFSALLGTIAFFNSFDMAVPIEYICDAVDDKNRMRKLLGGSLKFDIDEMISHLIKWGELVIVTVNDQDMVSLPHKTLAEEFWRHAAKNLDRILYWSPDEDHEPYASIDETLTMSLLMWLDENGPDCMSFAFYHMIVINIEKWYKSSVIPSFLQKHVDEFIEAIIEYTNLFRGLLGTTVVLDEIVDAKFTDQWYSLFISCIERSEKPWKIISFIHSNREMQRDRKICTAILNSKEKIVRAIEQEQRHWEIIRGVLLREELRDDPLVRRGITMAIDRDVESWWIIRELLKWDSFRNDEEIQQATARAITEQKNIQKIISVVCEWDDLRNNQVIREAIATAIGKSTEAWRTIEEICRFTELREDPTIRDAIILAIEQDPTTWRIIAELTKWADMRRDERVQAAVHNTIPSLAQAIATASMPWEILDAIDDWPGLVMAPEIVDAVTQAMVHVDEPWRLIAQVGRRKELMNDERIVTAIHQVKKKLAAEIRHISNPLDIIADIRSAKFLRTDPAIVDAITAVKSKILAIIKSSYNPIRMASTLFAYPVLKEDPEIQAALQETKTILQGAIERRARDIH